MGTSTRFGWVAAVALLAAPVAADDKADLLAAFDRGRKLAADGNYEDAAASYEKALALAPTVFGADHPSTAAILNNLAIAYLEQGQYAKAEPPLRRSLAIAEARFGKDHPETASALSELAVLYASTGRYDKAEPLYLQALAVQEAKLGKDHPGTAVTLNNLAILYERQAAYAKAEPLYQRTLAILEAKVGKDHSDTAATLGNLAGLYRSMGQYQKAEPLYLRALAVREAKLGKDHPATATTLHNLAILYQHLAQPAKAEELCQRALAVREAKLGKDHPATATALDTLASIYDVQREYAKAEPLSRRALAIREDRLGEEHPDTAKTLNNLAGLYKNTAQYAKAEPLFLRSLAIKQRKLGPDHPDTATTLSNLADLYAAMGEWDKAARARDRLRRLVRGFVSTTLPILSHPEQEQFLRTQDQGWFYEAMSYGLLRRDRPADRELSAGWVLNGKAVAAQVQAEAVLLARESRDPRAAPLSRQLNEVRQALAALTLHAPQQVDPTSRVRQVAELSAREQDLARQLTQVTGREAKAAWVEPADVRRAIPRDGVLVEIVRFDRTKIGWKPGEKSSLGERYAAWVIPPAGDVVVVDLGDAGPIDAGVAAVRKELEGADKTIRAKGEPAAEKQVRKPLDDLSALVLTPLLPHIGSAKSWVVSPDGNLWLAPWAALTLPDGKYATEGHDIRFVVTGRDLLAARNAVVQPTAPLIMADPDFDLGLAAAAVATKKLLTDGQTEHRGLSKDFKLGNVRPLPGTAAEAEAVAPKLRQYAGADPVVRTDADALTGVFKAARSPRVVVLSTHGFFLEAEKVERSNDGKPASPAGENPLLRCGLLLAGCNHAAEAAAGGDTGVLTGLEIVGTDLRGTELVVLSACETGLGDVRNGEGVAGLRQAFQLAGAGSVVATLWKVPDRESAQLMAGFFDRVSAKVPRDAALADAQRAAIKGRRDRFGTAHPYFWAAYTLTGRSD